jgi:hypothetical protein
MIATFTQAGVALDFLLSVACFGISFAIVADFVAREAQATAFIAAGNVLGSGHVQSIPL